MRSERTPAHTQVSPRHTGGPPGDTEPPGWSPGGAGDQHTERAANPGVRVERPPDVSHMSPAQAALAYARTGRRVLPLSAGTKRPIYELTPHGLTDATTDVDVIRDWFRWRPTPLVASVVPDGLVVLDFDPRHGGLLGVLERAARCILAPTLTVISGRGDGPPRLLRAPRRPAQRGPTPSWRGSSGRRAGVHHRSAVAPPIDREALPLAGSDPARDRHAGRLGRLPPPANSESLTPPTGAPARPPGPTYRPVDRVRCHRTRGPPTRHPPLGRPAGRRDGRRGPVRGPVRGQRGQRPRPQRRPAGPWTPRWVGRY